MTIAARIREARFSALENYLASLPADLRQFGIRYLADANPHGYESPVADGYALMCRRYGRDRVQSVMRRLRYEDARNTTVVLVDSKRGPLTFAYLVTKQGDKQMDRENIATVRDQLRRYAKTGEFTPRHSSEPDITEFGRVFRLSRAAA
jgi:hypothetical protein